MKKIKIISCILCLVICICCGCSNEVDQKSTSSQNNKISNNVYIQDCENCSIKINIR